MLRSGLSCALGAVAMMKLLALAGDGPVRDTLLPPWALFAISLLEIAIATALATRWWVHGAWSAAIAGTAFLVGTAVLLAMGVEPSSCGCFGSWKASAGTHVMVSSAIFCLALGVLFEKARLGTREAIKGRA